jgi:hypothetical protein
MPWPMAGTLTRRSLGVRTHGYAHDVNGHANHIDWPLLAARLLGSARSGKAG